MTITLSTDLPAYPTFTEGIRRAPDRGYRLTPAQTETALRNALRYIPVELHEQLANYDGVGYYMTDLVVPEKWRDKEIFLYFGGVDESAKIWINGKFAHERLHKDHDDWRKPFTVLISHLINWDLPRQNVVVRVHDQKGDGGIWKRVYLVCRDKTQ